MVITWMPLLKNPRKETVREMGLGYFFHTKKEKKRCLISLEEKYKIEKKRSVKDIISDVFKMKKKNTKKK